MTTEGRPKRLKEIGERSSGPVAPSLPDTVTRTASPPAGQRGPVAGQLSSWPPAPDCVAATRAGSTPPIVGEPPPEALQSGASLTVSDS
jgi:hypothetical protein